MADTYTKIELESVDKAGLNFHVAGVHQGRPYEIELWQECDGRDVEATPLQEGGYNPLYEDTDFFFNLCQHPRYVSLGNAGYKAWEFMPQR